MRVLLLRYLAVGAAGFMGAISRVMVGSMFGRFSGRFPLGTMVINLSGSLFLGWFLTHAANRNISDTAKLAIGAGFVGAYTTFSTFMYESNWLIDQGAAFKAIVNLVGSLILGLIAVRLGMYIARWI